MTNKREIVMQAEVDKVVVDRLVAERVAEAEATRLIRQPARPRGVRRRLGIWLIGLGETIAAGQAPREAN
jgi:hypothetical protein